MGAKRRILAVAIALGLAPGTLVRTDVTYDYDGPVEITQLDFAPATSGPLELAGVWQLTSENAHFGGYSGIVSQPDDSFLAISDQGRLLQFERPDRSSDAPRIDGFPGFRSDDWMKVDAEAIATDPASGRIWIAIEELNRIVRFGRDRRRRSTTNPPEMIDWPENGGAESMVLMADGRFLVVAEEDFGKRLHRALLYSEDPLRAEEVTAFQLLAPEGFRPSDAARLPDGRIAVLLRGLEFGWPLRFPVQLAVFDPARISQGATIALKPVATIDTPFPSENYEGLTVIEEDGGWTMWLISDDNFNSFQRTLLLKLRWRTDWRQARQKARR